MHCLHVLCVVLTAPVLHSQCRKIVKQRGCENLTVDQLVKDVTPIGRAMVPDRREGRRITVHERFYQHLLLNMLIMHRLSWLFPLRNSVKAELLQAIRGSLNAQQ